MVSQCLFVMVISRAYNRIYYFKIHGGGVHSTGLAAGGAEGKSVGACPVVSKHCVLQP